MSKRTSITISNNARTWAYFVGLFISSFATASSWWRSSQSLRIPRSLRVDGSTSFFAMCRLFKCCLLLQYRWSISLAEFHRVTLLVTGAKICEYTKCSTTDWTIQLLRSDMDRVYCLTLYRNDIIHKEAETVWSSSN